ncbi:MAG: 50S ribosomal protein L9 [Chitinophagales bacterium]
MEVLLLKNVENLGDKNEVVTVKNGYGRNYLIPQGMAIIANKSLKKHAQEIAIQQSAKAKKLLEDMTAIAASLQEKVLKVGAKAGASGKLFGSVNNIQLAEAMKKQFDLDIDRRKIKIAGDIKELGTYKASVVLHKELTTEIDFEVIEE